MRNPGSFLVNFLGRYANTLAFLILIIFWAILYLPSLRSYPGWYGDETLAVTAAKNLLSLPPTHRSFQNTFWHPYAPYQPGYLLLVRFGLWITDGDILGARLLNCLIALAVAMILFSQGKKIIGYSGALAAALWLLSYDQAILHYRWVFTHNLISLGFLWAFFSLCRVPSRKADLNAGLGLAVAFAALPLALYGLFAALAIRWKSPGSWIWISAPGFAVVALSLLAGTMVTSSPDFIFSDLRATFEFYTGATADNSGTFLGAIQNLLAFATHDRWHLAGFLGMGIGLFWKRIRPVAIAAWIVAVLLTQNRQNLPVFYYQAIILLPLMLFCMVGAIVFAIRVIANKVKLQKRSRLFCLALLPATAVLTSAAMAISVSKQQILPRNQLWVTQSTAEVDVAAEWINGRVTAEDLVICHHNIAWLLHCRTADYLQWVTWLGKPTWPFATPLPKAQFIFEPDLSRARYAVVGDIDVVWTFHQPNVAELLQKAELESWPVVWQGEWYVILKNPNLQPGSMHENLRHQPQSEK